MLCLIVAPGATHIDPFHRSVVDKPDLVIAVDAGLGDAAAIGLSVDVAVGDMDSVDPVVLARHERAGGAVDRHPRRKDATDLELAFGLAADRGATRAVLLGGFGGRLDQTVANALLPLGLRWPLGDVRALGDGWCARWFRGPGTFTLDARAGETVSLLALSTAVRAIWTDGLEYPLSGDQLDLGSTRGVSNVAVRPDAEVRLKEGVLLCITLHDG
jgi:thiamine pyrophosphokinase